MTRSSRPIRVTAWQREQDTSTEPWSAAGFSGAAVSAVEAGTVASENRARLPSGTVRPGRGARPSVAGAVPGTQNRARLPRGSAAWRRRRAARAGVIGGAARGPPRPPAPA